MDAADKADILRRWSAFQRVLGRPEHELTWHNCVRELDLDKRTRCLDCGTEGSPYIVHNHVWAQTGLAYDGGVLCFDCLRRKCAPTLIPRMRQSRPRLNWPSARSESLFRPPSPSGSFC